MKRLKKLSEETIHTNPWWTYKHDTYEKPNGEIGDYYYGVEKGMVMAVPRLPDGKLVLTLQHRYLEEKQSIEFPAGGIHDGETIQQSAERELKEETGCHAVDMMFAGTFEALNGFFKSRGHVFVADVELPLAQSLDDTEQIEVLYRTPKEFDEMVLKNEIWDGQTLSAWALVRHHFQHVL